MDKIILRKERNFHSGTNSFRLIIQNEIHKLWCPKCAANSSLMSKELVKGNIWRVGCIKCKQSSSGAQLCKQLSFYDFIKSLKCYPTLEFSKKIRWLKILPGKFKKNEVIPKLVTYCFPGLKYECSEMQKTISFFGHSESHRWIRFYIDESIFTSMNPFELN